MRVLGYNWYRKPRVLFESTLGMKSRSWREATTSISNSEAWLTAKIVRQSQDEETSLSADLDALGPNGQARCNRESMAWEGGRRQRPRLAGLEVASSSTRSSPIILSCEDMHEDFPATASCVRSEVLAASQNMRAIACHCGSVLRTYIPNLYLRSVSSISTGPRRVSPKKE